jgi:hypothetical protein
MTKLIAILFSTLFFLQSANIHFGDVQKLGELFEHYNLHNERYEDNFTTFISKHYGDLKENHKEEHKEEEKNHHHDPIQHDCTAQVQIDIVILDFSITLKTIKFIESKETNFYYQDKFSTFEKQKIFQPPQFS